MPRKGRRQNRKSLADALFTRTQQRVLGVLFGRPDRSFYASELIRTAGTGSGAAQRELAKLEDSGLVVGRRVGHQKHYQANTEAPVFGELRSIVLKTVALAEPLRTALRPLSSAIRAAFVYGSVAKASDHAASDIDLMIVSESLSYGEVFGALERTVRQLGRRVNPTVCTAAEFSKRARSENAFVTRVLDQPKIWISAARMTSQPPLDRLAGPGGVLSNEPPEANEYGGLLESGLARLRDAARR